MIYLAFRWTIITLMTGFVFHGHKYFSPPSHFSHDNMVLLWWFLLGLPRWITVWYSTVHHRSVTLIWGWCRLSGLLKSACALTREMCVLSKNTCVLFAMERYFTTVFVRFGLRRAAGRQLPLEQSVHRKYQNIWEGYEAQHCTSEPCTVTLAGQLHHSSLIRFP